MTCWHIYYSPLSIDVKVIPHKVPCLDRDSQNLGKYKLEFKAEPLGFRPSEAYQFKTVCDVILSKLPVNWETEAFCLKDGKLRSIFKKKENNTSAKAKTNTQILENEKQTLTFFQFFLFPILILEFFSFFHKNNVCLNEMYVLTSL